MQFYSSKHHDGLLHYLKYTSHFSSRNDHYIKNECQLTPSVHAPATNNFLIDVVDLETGLLGRLLHVRPDLTFLFSEENIDKI